MSRNSLLETLFVRTSKSSPTISRKRPAFSCVKLELLEDRTAPAALNWTGIGSVSGMTSPQITSGTLNGGAAAAEFAGPQHSRIVNLQFVFDQAVQLDPGAMALSLHVGNVSYGGVPQPSGMGAVPTLAFTPSAAGTIWTVTFSGPNAEVGSIDGFASLVDGVYDFTVDGSKVHPVGNPLVNMSGSPTTTFARLFGETGDPAVAPNGTDFATVVSSGDNLQFRTAFNSDADYKAYLDFDGNGSINTGDNLAFRSRFNKPLTWTADSTDSNVATANTPSAVVGSAPAPQVASITPNFGDTARQNSRIVNIVVTFDQPVLLDDGALVLTLHTNNVRYAGALQPSGMGAIPNINVIHGDDLMTWLVVFSGPNTEGAGANGASLMDGVYDFTVDASKVHSGANLSVNMASNQAITFHRLFGDSTPVSSTAAGGSTDFSAVVNSGDNLAFRTAFNNAAGYKAYLDFNGDGAINSADNLAFRTRFNKSLTWTA